MDGDEYDGDEYDGNRYNVDYEQQERGARGRSTMTGRGSENISKSTRNATPEDRFKTIVNAKCMKLKSYLKLTDTDISKILSSIQKVSNPQYKNPLAYILGYYVLSYGNISESKFKTVKDLLEDQTFLTMDDSVMPADVIRYATLWQSL